MKTFFGWLLTSLGLLFLAVEADHILSGESKNLVVGLAIAGICLTGGFSLLASARKRRLALAERKRTHALEQGLSRDSLVLQTARQHGGRVTAAEIAADTVLSYAMANETLEELCKHGACRMVVTDAGVVVYHFPEFESAAAKGQDYLS